MRREDTPEKTLQTLERGFEIVELLEERGGGGISEVAAALDLPKSTVYNHLVTLRELGYLVQEGDEYRIGLRFLTVGGHAATRKEAYRMAEPKVEELAAETGERAQFVVEENGRAIYVDQATGDRAVRTDVRIGKRAYLHTLAAGKAILAALPEERVEAILDRWGLPQRTDQTITDRGELLDHLDRVRERGYAFNREERIDGQRAAGVAVTDAEGGVIGAISVSGPTDRMRGEWFDREIPERLLGTINELELNITYR